MIIRICICSSLLLKFGSLFISADDQGWTIWPAWGSPWKASPNLHVYWWNCWVFFNRMRCASAAISLTFFLVYNFSPVKCIGTWYNLGGFHSKKNSDKIYNPNGKKKCNRFVRNLIRFLLCMDQKELYGE